MLNIILITDKKAGHESISKGLISFIQKKHEVNIFEIYAKRRVKAFMKLGVYLVNLLPLNKNVVSFLLKVLYKKFQIDLDKKYDFIVSTGGDTALLNILLAKFLNIPNFYCSSLRGLNSKLFTNIISIIDNKYENEILLDIAPISVDIEEKELSGNFFSILIGGATKNYKFTDEEFVNIVEKLIILAEKKQFKIFLTTSRRTPLNVEAKIKELVIDKKDLFEKAVFFNEKPEKVMKYFLRNSDMIFCTEDSGSMITESVLSKKKVYSISSRNKKLDKIFKTFMKNLTEKKYLLSLNIDKIDTITLEEEFKKIDYSPAQKVYDEIKKGFSLMKKSVAIVVPNLAGSGGEKIALIQAKMFHENNYTVVLFLLEDLKVYSTDEFDFPIVALTNKKDKYKIFGKLGYKIYAKILEKKMNEFGKFDLVISNLPRADRTVKELNHCNKYFVIHMSYKAELGNFPKEKTNRKLKLYRYLYKNENVVTVSNAIINELDDLNIIYKSIKTIYNPFYFDEIIEKGNESIEYDFEYIIAPTAFRKQKRYDVLLDAILNLKDKELKLLILAEKNPELKKMIKDRRLEERVIVAGFKQNPYKYIKNAKLLVLSSEREGLPTVIIESLILSTPVVSTDCPTGPNEILINNLSSWLVPVNNPDKLASKINEALKSNIIIDRKNLERFNYKKVFKEYESLY